MTLKSANRTAVSVDEARLWQTLMEIGQIGETPKGGSNRVAFTDLDVEGRNLFRTWAEAAGCSHHVDGFGNQVIRREGRGRKSGLSWRTIPPVTGDMRGCCTKLRG